MGYGRICRCYCCGACRTRELVWCTPLGKPPHPCYLKTVPHLSFPFPQFCCQGWMSPVSCRKHLFLYVTWLRFFVALLSPWKERKWWSHIEIECKGLTLVSTWKTTLVARVTYMVSILSARRPDKELRGIIFAGCWRRQPNIPRSPPTIQHQPTYCNCKS